MVPIRDTSGGATFAIKVQPRARKNAITGEVGDALKLALTAPPVEGRANEACVEFLAEILGVSRSSVTIAAGQSSRNKVIRVAGLSAEEVRRRLEGKAQPQRAQRKQRNEEGRSQNEEVKTRWKLET